MAWWQIVSIVVAVVAFIGFVAYGRTDQYGEPWMFVLLGFLISGTAVALIIIPLAAREQAQWEAWCRSNGGTVSDHTSTTVGTGVSANGQPVVTVGSDTTYYCLTPDGRVR